MRCKSRARRGGQCKGHVVTWEQTRWGFCASLGLDIAPQHGSNKLFLNLTCQSTRPLPEWKAKNQRAVTKPGFINGREPLSWVLSYFLHRGEQVPISAKENSGHTWQLLLFHLNHKNRKPNCTSCRHVAFSFTSLWHLSSTGLFRENTIWPAHGEMWQHTAVPAFVDCNPWGLLIFLSKYGTLGKAKIFLNNALFLEPRLAQLIDLSRF